MLRSIRPDPLLICKCYHKQAKAASCDNTYCGTIPLIRPRIDVVAIWIEHRHGRHEVQQDEAMQLPALVIERKKHDRSPVLQLQYG